ncbi:MAG: Gfo/Idh/MocA family oxidoreductase [Caldilineaceae bacterium]|nr:Gfo/Idh/MocA family oxidoreductase [Caldilineaceae bacterium]
MLGAARITPNALIYPARQNERVAITALAAREPQVARTFATKHGIPQVYDTYAALLADATIDAIYNPLPNSLHAEWTLRALAAGKHVLCEKPLAANAQEAEAMAQRAETTGLVLMEAFHTLYHPLAKRMKAIIDSGELGQLRQLDLSFCTLMWRWWDIRLRYDLAGGATMDLGCYAIRLLRFLVGTEPTVVRAQAQTAAPQIDRWMTAQLAFPNDVTASFTCAFWSTNLIRITARVIGTAGEMTVLNPILPQLYHRVQVQTATGTRTEQLPGATTYAYQLHAFVDAIQQPQPLLTDGRDGVANMRVIDAVYEKAGLKRRGT